MKKAQISLEFMLIFGIVLILLAYSLNNVTFNQGSQSSELLRVQVSIEEKHFANIIADAVSQVYAQGPGSKVTIYFKPHYLKDEERLKRAFGYAAPTIQILYENGTAYVGVTDGADGALIYVGSDRNTFGAVSLYNATIAGISLSPSTLPSALKIQAEWIPEAKNSIVFTNGVIKITINGTINTG